MISYIRSVLSPFSFSFFLGGGILTDNTKTAIKPKKYYVVACHTTYAGGDIVMQILSSFTVSSGWSTPFAGPPNPTLHSSIILSFLTNSYLQMRKLVWPSSAWFPPISMTWSRDFWGQKPNTLLGSCVRIEIIKSRKTI